MHAIVDQKYVRRHPGEVIQTFGLLNYIRALSGGPGLLERLTRAQLEHGIPLPGRIGHAYRLSAILELRAAQVYTALAQRFASQAPVREFFEQLAAEEQEHARLMLLCLHTAHADSAMTFTPSIRAPEIRELLHSLRQYAREAWKMSLDQALDLTNELEASEVNVIFDRLLAQARTPQSDFFASRLAKAEGHATVVPKRIRALRQRLRVLH